MKKLFAIVLLAVMLACCAFAFTACGGKSVVGKTYKLDLNSLPETIVNYNKEQYLVFGEDGTVTKEYYDARIFEDKNVITHKGTYEQNKYGVAILWSEIGGKTLEVKQAEGWNVDENGNLTKQEEVEIKENIIKNKLINVVFKVVE